MKSQTALAELESIANVEPRLSETLDAIGNLILEKDAKIERLMAVAVAAEDLITTPQKDIENRDDRDMLEGVLWGNLVLALRDLKEGEKGKV